VNEVSEMDEVNSPARTLRRLDEMPAVRIASLVARLVLGAVMLVAGAEKLAALDVFAASIDAYKLLPLPLINIAALLFVWVELTAGILLLIGAATRGAALISGVLLLVFIGAVGSAMARGLNIDCGCFQGREQRRPTAVVSPGPGARTATFPSPLPMPDSPAAASDIPISAPPAGSPERSLAPSGGGQQVGWPKIFENAGLLALALFLIWYPKSFFVADASLRREGEEDSQIPDSRRDS
jgi:uncharacterized membrane protein YphA (DoxX/SURF4 family)